MNDKFYFSRPKNSPVSSEELLDDLKSVAAKLNVKQITQKQYKQFGKYDVTNLSRRFGTWNKALLEVGLKPGNVINYTDEELFENILNIWQRLGKQPVRNDLKNPPSKISQGPYSRRFKSWNNALISFINYANNNDLNVYEQISPKNLNTNGHKTSRDPSLRLRFNVLKRDNFSCKQCGASPAKDNTIELHIDHIIPWSKGGETTIENLQTLCSKCNYGKSNLL